MKSQGYKRIIAFTLAVSLLLSGFTGSSSVVGAAQNDISITENGTTVESDVMETQEIVQTATEEDSGEKADYATPDDAEENDMRDGDTSTENTASSDIPIEDLKLYDEKERTDLDENEIAKASNINVLIDSSYDVSDVHDGIEFDEESVEVKYVPEKAEFDITKEGNYQAWYKVTPYSGKRPYLIRRTVNISKPDVKTVSDNSAANADGSGDKDSQNKGSKDKTEEDDDSDPAHSEDKNKQILAGDVRTNNDLPLSKGEIESIQSNYASFVIKLDDNQDAEMIEEGIDPETGRQDEDLKDDTGNSSESSKVNTNDSLTAGAGRFFSGEGMNANTFAYGSSVTQLETKEVDNSLGAKVGKTIANIFAIIFPAKTVLAADSDKDSMKVGYSGYAGFCGHRTGVKYITEDGKYKNHLVYCLDMNRNTTSGTVNAGGKVKAQITFCLVNGARTLGGKCHNDAYSTGDATADYFVTSASIHVLNGEVSLAYYNDGSSVYKKIEKMVADAKKIDKTKYNLETGLTKSVTYTITPKKASWKKVADGLYKSDEKFVRTKSGSITDVKYTISGAPEGLKTGEIKKDAKDIVDEEDLKKYDICVAQTDKDKASSNFYIYANEEAMKKIVEDKLTIKIQAKAYADEKGGRKWTPTVVSQQKITFLEEFNTLSAKATVKVTSNYKLGSISVKKTDKFDPSKGIAGATYYLYEDITCQDLLCELKDKGNGLYSTDIETLTQDTYWIQEVDNPDGYQLDNTVYAITSDWITEYDADGKVTKQGKVFSHEEIPEKVGVFVTKKDSFTKKEITTAGFAVFNDPGCTVRTKVDTGDNAAVVPIFHYDDDLGGAMSEKFIKTQATYYVKEVEVPNGYKDPGTVWTVSPGYGDVSQIAAENTPLRCGVNAVKVDKETGQPVAQGDGALAGALYGLYAIEDIVYPDGSGVVTYNENDPIKSDKGTDFQFFKVPAKAGTLLATVKTDDKAAFSFLNMYIGKYSVKEIEPSTGYVLSTDNYPLDFSSKKGTHADILEKLTVTETPVKQPFQIIKVSTDGDNGETDIVEGAEFTVKLKSDVDNVGWDEAKTVDILTTDDKGYALSKELPYGIYLVKETKVPKDLYRTDDFIVTIEGDSREPQIWRTLNDAPFKAYIRFVKKDKETGEIVRLPSVTFKIKKVGDEDYISLKVGDKKVSEFVTDETGTVTTPLRLKYGDYEVTEIKAPDGYLLSEDSVQFTVTKEGAIEIEEDEDGDPVISIEMENESVKGSVTIHKEGEILCGANYDTIIDRILTAVTGDNRSVTFAYENQPLEGAVYHLIADEDIIRADHMKDEEGNETIAVYNDIPLAKDTVVAELTTDADGKAEVGDLPLGKYRIEEVEAPEGFVLDEEAKHFELAYEDDHTEIVYQNEEYVDERVKTEITLHKKDAVNDTPVQGAAYGVYATVDITDRNDEILVAADSLIERVETDENGDARFESDLPLGKYYVKEIEAAPGYVTDPTEYEVDFTYQDAKTDILSKEIDVKETPIIVQVSKSDITNEKEVIGAELEIRDNDNEVYANWKTTGEAYTLHAIPAGKYKLKEVSAPYGYTIANEVGFEVMETGEIQKVTMVDDRIKGFIEIYKTDSETKKPIKGVKFELRDEKGKVIQKLKTNKDGYAKSKELDICTYKDNGEKDKDITYFVVETKAAKGYVLDDKPHKVIITYVGNATMSIPYKLTITNKPETPDKPKLPQTGGNYTPWIFILLGSIFITVFLVLSAMRRKELSLTDDNDSAVGGGDSSNK
jgi:uncharacterized surface anchored protein